MSECDHLPTASRHQICYKPPSNSNMTDVQAATDQEIFNEPEWAETHGHRVGLRDQNDRFPGLTHGDDEWRYEIEKEAEAKLDELKDLVVKGNLVTVRDFMNKQEVGGSVGQGWWVSIDASVF